MALITGAGSPQGIGFATARLLAQQGSKIAITSTTERIEERARELAAEGADVFAFPADLRDHARTHVLVQEVLARYGRLDILVNNAGMTQVGSPTETTSLPLAELPESEWDYGIAINLKTAFNVTKAVLPFMLTANYGRIVNVSSVTGPVVSNPRETAYSAAKAGMVGLTRSLALEVARQGITVNAVAPAGSKPRPPPGTKSSLVKILPSAAPAAPTKSPLLSRFSPPNPPPTSPANCSSLTAATPSRSTKARPICTTEREPAGCTLGMHV